MPQNPDLLIRSRFNHVQKALIRTERHVEGRALADGFRRDVGLFTNVPSGRKTWMRSALRSQT